MSWSLDSKTRVLFIAKCLFDIVTAPKAGPASHLVGAPRILCSDGAEKISARKKQDPSFCAKNNSFVLSFLLSFSVSVSPCLSVSVSHHVSVSVFPHSLDKPSGHVWVLLLPLGLRTWSEGGPHQVFEDLPVQGDRQTRKQTHEGS